MRFRKKPIVIEAEKWTPDMSLTEGLPSKPRHWPNGVYEDKDSKTGFSISTLEGKHEVTPNDWIITGVKGETYPVKPDIFELTYEKV